MIQPVMIDIDDLNNIVELIHTPVVFRINDYEFENTNELAEKFKDKKVSSLEIVGKKELIDYEITFEERHVYLSSNLPREVIDYIKNKENWMALIPESVFNYLSFFLSAIIVLIPTLIYGVSIVSKLGILLSIALLLWVWISIGSLFSIIFVLIIRPKNEIVFSSSLDKEPFYKQKRVKNFLSKAFWLVLGVLLTEFVRILIH